jgi:SAM-dependent methyltransferase
MNLKDSIKKFLRKNGKTDFLSKLNSDSSILDVGCGNNSPFRAKQILPNCVYTGLDVADYNQTKPLLADNYIITSPQNFSNEIARFSNVFDAVISTHNLEHCDDREMTLTAMLEALKIGGKLYLSFPCEDSINFPHRGETLNYYDDPTHKLSPLNFNETLAFIQLKGFDIVYAERNYSRICLLKKSCCNNESRSGCSE